MRNQLSVIAAYLFALTNTASPVPAEAAAPAPSSTAGIYRVMVVPFFAASQDKPTSDWKAKRLSQLLSTYQRTITVVPPPVVAHDLLTVHYMTEESMARGIESEIPRAGAASVADFRALGAKAGADFVVVGCIRLYRKSVGMTYYPLIYPEPTAQIECSTAIIDVRDGKVREGSYFRESTHARGPAAQEDSWLPTDPKQSPQRRLTEKALADAASSIRGFLAGERNPRNQKPPAHIKTAKPVGTILSIARTNKAFQSRVTINIGAAEGIEKGDMLDLRPPGADTLLGIMRVDVCNEHSASGTMDGCELVKPGFEVRLFAP